MVVYIITYFILAIVSAIIFEVVFGRIYYFGDNEDNIIGLFAMLWPVSIPSLIVVCIIFMIVRGIKMLVKKKLRSD